MYSWKRLTPMMRFARDPTQSRRWTGTGVPAVVLGLCVALVAACGDPPPTSPSVVPSAPLASSTALQRLGSIGAFATAPDTATLKVTAPRPESPTDDVVIEGQRAALAVSSAMGHYVEAAGLRMGFAIWQVGSDGGLTLLEAEEIPQTDGTSTYAVDTMLDHDTQYRWRGRAVLEGAYGPWSAWASFRTAPPPPPPPPPPAPPLPSDPQARYIAIFEADWSAATHPQDFPSNPHFSPMIGATHLAGTRFWEAGAIASEGIERMAEEGSQSPLDGEIAAAQAAGQAETLFRGGGLSPSPGLETVEFDITSAFPYVTLVSMVAPSPDWFVGVSGLLLIANGEWRNEVVVELLPWDAGTDSGASYDSLDADLQPQAPIALLQTAPVVVNGSVPAFGRFTFRRLD